MTSDNESGGEEREVKSSSGATRRIVVQDLPPDEVPPTRGRRLATPVDDVRTGPSASPRESYSSRGKESEAGSTRSSIKRDRSSTPRLRELTGGGPERKLRRTLFISAAILAFGLLVTMVLIVLTRTSGSKKALQATRPEARNPAGSGTEKSSPVPQLPQAVTDANNLQAPVEADDGTLLDAREVQSLSEKLASQVSQKTGYLFAPDFVELIRARTRDYSNKQAVEKARQYRREINKSFRDEGLTPLIGYVIAMSRSRFEVSASDKGLGMWQIPPAVARSQGYLGSAENTSRLTAPESSAQISATYTKALLSTFDAEDFIYAIACFGMDLQEAGKVQARLISAVPDARNRLEVMNAIKAGVLSAEQVDSIARFFAAGIVGENPREFGLPDSQRFSSLY